MFVTNARSFFLVSSVGGRFLKVSSSSTESCTWPEIFVDSPAEMPLVNASPALAVPIHVPGSGGGGAAGCWANASEVHERSIAAPANRTTAFKAGLASCVDNTPASCESGQILYFNI